MSTATTLLDPPSWAGILNTASTRLLVMHPTLLLRKSHVGLAIQTEADSTLYHRNAAPALIQALALWAVLDHCMPELRVVHTPPEGGSPRSFGEALTQPHTPLRGHLDITDTGWVLDIRSPSLNTSVFVRRTPPTAHQRVRGTAVHAALLAMATYPASVLATIQHWQNICRPSDASAAPHSPLPSIGAP